MTRSEENISVEEVATAEAAPVTDRERLMLASDHDTAAAIRNMLSKQSVFAGLHFSPSLNT